MTAVDPESRTGLAGWWLTLGRGQRAAVAALALIIGVNVALAALGGLVGGDPGGPVSSSFSTGSDGVQAWSELLGRTGHLVTRLRTSVARADLPSNATVVVAAPGRIARADQRRLARFVADGGRLVAMGESSAELLRTVTGARIVAGEGEPGIRTWVPVPETAGVGRVAGGTGAAFSVTPPFVAVAGSAANATGALVGSGPAGAALLVADVGRGRVVAVAEATVFQNSQLGSADNAVLSLQVVGSVKRPVVFVESVHGFGATGAGALPSNWKWALAGIAATVVVGLWSAGTRFGAAEPAERKLRPARLDHVAAVAADLDRITVSNDDVVAPLADRTRSALAARVGAPPDASAAVLQGAAERAGIAPHQVATLTTPVVDLDHALAVGELAAARQRADHAVTDTVAAQPTSGGSSP